MKQKLRPQILCLSIAMFLSLAIIPESHGGFFDFSKKTSGQKRSLNKRKFNDMSKISKGMTREKVHKILGESIKVGFEDIDVKTSTFKEIKIKNPEKQETIIKKGKTYTVDFYLVEIKRNDGIISDDELLPLIYYNDIVYSRGWDQVLSLRNIANLK